MKISLGLYPNQPAADLVATGRLADELGFHALWVADSHLLWREVHVLLGALAASTARIRLGTAVTNPLTRHPSVTASALATLSELSGGRAVLGISVGDSALRTIGLDIATMARLEEVVVGCRDLFAGRSVTFAHRETARLAASPVGIPIYIAATGPKMLALAGRTADGVILMNGVAPELIRSAADIVRNAARAAGRPEGTPKLLAWAACHSSPDAVKYNVARAILRMVPGADDPLTRRTRDAIKAAYDYAEHGSAEAAVARLIPDELVPRYCFAGSPDTIARQVAALASLGVDEVALAVPQASSIAPRDDIIRQLAPVLLGTRSR